MRFVWVDSRHNIFHWLTVVLIRIGFFLTVASFSFYLVGIGSLFAKTAKPLPFGGEKIALYSARLPYFLKIEKFIFTQLLNHWYQDAPVWWTMVVGIPLILLGITIFLINFFNLFYSIFIPTYNRTHCLFCKQPIKAK